MRWRARSGCSHKHNLTITLSVQLSNFCLNCLCRFNAAGDPDLKMFDEVAGNEAEEQEMGDDDDIIVDSRVSKNEKCPYTLVPVSATQLAYVLAGNGCFPKCGM